MGQAIKTILSLVLMLQFSSIVAAYDKLWQVDEEASKLHFVSIKQSTILEVHQFENLKGSIDETGLVRIDIDLTSVNTGIPIRNSRMKQYLFETAKYDMATLSAAIDISRINKIPVGSTHVMQSMVTVDLHGHQKQYRIALNVSKKKDQSLVVETIDPLIINAADFGLLEGLAQLQKMANLRAMNKLVIPVLGSLHFKSVK